VNIKTAKLIYFSPTGTTRKVTEAIAQGAWIVAVEHVDLTPSDARMQKIVEMHEELDVSVSGTFKKIN